MSCSRSEKLAGNADEVRFQLNERGDVDKHPKDALDEGKSFVFSLHGCFSPCIFFI